MASFYAFKEIAIALNQKSGRSVRRDKPALDVSFPTNFIIPISLQYISSVVP
jgi:hypothetical protein